MANEQNELYQLFMKFCQFGDKRNEGIMTSVKWIKFCKDCRLFEGEGHITHTDADLIFTKAKPKNERHLDFEQFQVALAMFSIKKYPDKEKKSAMQMVFESLDNKMGPSSSGTVAEPVKFHDDKSLYTGVYRSGGPSTVDKKKYIGRK